MRFIPTLRDLERVMIARRLREYKGNRKLAAKSLGISVRKLYYHLAEQRDGF